MRAIFVDKQTIYSVHIRRDKVAAYNYFLQSLMRFDNGRLVNAVVKIDGSGDRTFRKTMEGYLRRQLPQGAIREVKFKDSQGDVLIQLADMCAGAIARAHRPDEKKDSRWLDMLKPRIEDLWMFR